MFKIKQTASLSENYIITSSTLKNIRWFITVFLSVLSISTIIIFKSLIFQIFVLFISAIIIYRIENKIKGWAHRVEALLIVRENLLFMIRRNSFLFTAKIGPSYKGRPIFSPRLAGYLVGP